MALLRRFPATPTPGTAPTPTLVERAA
jgi:hypothetical protein